MPTSPKDSPTNSDSVDLVVPRFYLDLNGAGQTNTTLENTEIKCANCKVVTPTQWLMIHVADSFNEFNPVDLADKHRRLTLCQNCGTLRLVK